MARRLLAAWLLFPAAALAGAPARTKMAVMDVKNVQGVAEGTATILTDIVVSEAARRGYDVVSKNDIAAMVGFEKQKQMLGCSEDSACLAEIGGALGVDYMLTGQVGQIGSRYRISLLLVDTKRARVAARSAQFCDRNEDALAAAALATVDDLLSAVGPAPALRAAAPAGQAGPAVQAGVAPVAEARKSGPSHTGAWVAWGIGGTCLVAGIASGIAANSKYQSLSSQQGQQGYYQAWTSQQQQIKNLAGFADLMYGAALVSGGIGLWLWLSAGPAASVAVAPVVSDHSVGLAAAGRF